MMTCTDTGRHRAPGPEHHFEILHPPTGTQVITGAFTEDIYFKVRLVDDAWVDLMSKWIGKPPLEGESIGRSVVATPQKEISPYAETRLHIINQNQAAAELQQDRRPRQGHFYANEVIDPG